MFIDSVKIIVKAGSGGRGCNSLYRDKYQRSGVPDGGDGGRGADIIVRADRNLHTLLDLRYNRHFYGKHGAHGSGKNQKGKDAPAIIIRVPVGTVVKDVASGCILRDLDTDAEEVIVAAGGMGGLGNKYKREATSGEEKEEKELLLDLKVIAQVGVVGFPNAGKSTLITHISNAHPKIAAYPFTTKFPVLGVVRHEDMVFTVADIPGLIEGSSSGRGLGDQFLRHVERTKILVHLIDMSGSEGRSPLEDYRVINKELKAYNLDVAGKLQLIVANKMDLESSKLNLRNFKKVVRKKVYPISALTGDGLEELIEGISKKL
ncbi:MAG: GTPase ObgE [Candidatus Omnitrophica bacterium]|nr:GTPase ObgE [Candidatus Omnitrophota bacterium]